MCCCHLWSLQRQQLVPIVVGGTGVLGDVQFAMVLILSAGCSCSSSPPCPPGQIPLSLLSCSHAPAKSFGPETGSTPWSPAPTAPDKSRAERGLFPPKGMCWAPAKPPEEDIVWGVFGELCSCAGQPTHPSGDGRALLMRTLENRAPIWRQQLVASSRLGSQGPYVPCVARLRLCSCCCRGLVLHCSSSLDGPKHPYSNGGPLAALGACLPFTQPQHHQGALCSPFQSPGPLWSHDPPLPGSLCHLNSRALGNHTRSFWRLFASTLHVLLQETSPRQGGFLCPISAPTRERRGGGAVKHPAVCCGVALGKDFFTPGT